MRVARLCCLFLLAALVLTGCAGIRMEREYATPRMESPFRLSSWVLYIPNRVFDVLDVPVVGVQAGPGLNVRAQFTRVVDICFPTNSCGPEIGLNTQWVDPIKEDDAFPLWKRYRLFANGCHGGKAIPFPIINFNLGELETSPDQIDIGVHLLLVGAHVGIRPVEIADLITGFVFVDINHDDLTVAKGKKKDPGDEGGDGQ